MEPQFRTFTHVTWVAELRRVRALTPLAKHAPQRDELVGRWERPLEHLSNERRLTVDLPPNRTVQPRVCTRPVLQLRKLLRDPHHEAGPLVVGRLRHRPVRHAEPIRQFALRLFQAALAPVTLHEPRQHFLSQHLEQPLLLVQ